MKPQYLTLALIPLALLLLGAAKRGGQDVGHPILGSLVPA